MPVTGTIHRGSNPPVCGLPLGGIDTGCLDLEATGLLGYSSIFNALVPRRGPMNLPFLGIHVDFQTWILATAPVSKRSGLAGVTWIPPYIVDAKPNVKEYRWTRMASEIHYWGHYPVADIEFVTEAPVSVGLRAWSPFLPGDIAASNTPGAVFEVHLRNRTNQAQKGTLVFSFPGPSENEAGTTRFRRRAVTGDFRGLLVSCQEASYALGVIRPAKVRLGGDLGLDEDAWGRIAYELPPASRQAGGSVAVDFSISPRQTQVVRFVLAWYSPRWRGGGTIAAGGNIYAHMYASRYKDAIEVAQLLAREGAPLLSRILAWQSVIYRDANLPAWLRDSLINILHLIPECSVWAQAQHPIGEWCRPQDGLFGMNECPRGCPQIECIPCSFYGNLPLVYFFPELALSTLRGYKAYQHPNGAAPWNFGGVTTGQKPFEMALPSPGYEKKSQTVLDGSCYVEMVDKMWLRTNDKSILNEFYDSIKRNTIFTMNLRPGSGAAGIVSMPANNDGSDWFESCDLFGIVPHIGGVHLAHLRMARRMAEAMGDSKFVQQCDEWLQQGSAVMEGHAWSGSHYLLFHELETNKKSDIILGYQLDGEWIARFHGCEGVFRPDRVNVTLETIRRQNISRSRFGAAVFSKFQTGADKEKWDPGYWGFNGVHPPGTFMLAMTFMYCGQREFGLDLARRTVQEIIRRGWYWDWPVIIDGALGPRGGFDYYQNLMLWALLAAMAGGDLRTPCGPGQLVDRIFQAARGNG
jgi:uncharacterized protein (DUF608 family)